MASSRPIAEDQRLQLELDASALRRRLHHEDDEHVVGGIDEEEGSADAVPAIFAERPLGICRHRGADRKAEAETAGVAGIVRVVTRDSGPGADMIGRHQRDRRWLEIGASLIRPAVEQHLAEPRIVADRADHPRPAGFHSSRQHDVAKAGCRTDRAIVRHGLGNAKAASNCRQHRTPSRSSPEDRAAAASRTGTAIVPTPPRSHGRARRSNGRNPISCPAAPAAAIWRPARRIRHCRDRR